MGNTQRFAQIHIDVARNATDDFNPFHDKNRWQRIANNPFPAPIALGFQLECLIENHMRLYRMQQGENALIESEGLRFSHYEFKFVNAVQPNQAIDVIIKDSRYKPGDNPTLSNRVSLKADGKLAVAGYKRESNSPLLFYDCFGVIGSERVLFRARIDLMPLASETTWCQSDITKNSYMI